MLGRRNRISRREFAGVLSRSRGFHTSHFLVRIAAGGLDDSRGAVVVSKRVAPRAVTRNRLRRRVYAALEDAFAVSSAPLDIIVIVKRGASPLSLQEIKHELSFGITSSQG